MQLLSSLLLLIFIARGPYITARSTGMGMVPEMV